MPMCMEPHLPTNVTGLEKVHGMLKMIPGVEELSYKENSNRLGLHSLLLLGYKLSLVLKHSEKLLFVCSPNKPDSTVS